MSEDTLVVVQCYSGDAHQVDELLPSWTKHGFPVLLLSPEDARVEVEAEGVECRWSGKRGWSGQHTIDRQIEHWKIIASYPQTHVLYHDADSIVLSDEIPSYLYDRDVFWSNEQDSHEFLTRVAELSGNSSTEERDMQVREACRYLMEQGTADELYAQAPGVYQPPYFFSHRVLDEMIETAPSTQPLIPFIDWFYAAVCRSGPVAHAGYPDGVSLPAEEDSWKQELLVKARIGQACMVHSVKTAATAKLAEDAYREAHG